jgi:lipopolysaccharide/colanic/teichoic acid biosynthesis glycosyltransferase
MLVDKIFRFIFSVTTVLSYLIASFIIIPQDYLKNFNLVAKRLSEIFASTIFSSFSNFYFILFFVIFLIFFSFNIFKEIFNLENQSNQLQTFIFQELKFSTTLIVIFWVLRITDFSRLTVITATVLRFFLLLLLTRFYKKIRNRYHIKDVLLINFNPNLGKDFIKTLPGINLIKTIMSSDLKLINDELSKNSYDEVWITGSKFEDASQINILTNHIVEFGLSVKIDNLFEIKTTMIPKFEIIDGQNFISYSTSYLESNQYFFKRIFDIFFTILIGFLFLPISIIVSILIIVDSGFPIFFTQIRGGLNAKRFKIYKFRTMRVGADNERASLLNKNDLQGIGFKMHNDPRVTKFGNFLRKYSIDEIPQFINVLTGEMSVVGPRPAVFDEIDRYENWHRKRLSVRPGITGPWQLTDRLSTDFDERIRLDLNYIDTQSFLKDLIIILRTPVAMIKNKSA